ncbi:MAG: N-6 DNA methylase [Prolixibacteraceae bacterium]|jgi:adenine-specific DNA-methyltransferase|nr:N-6 DNA methylase [Prolixibacteraceae bacterium]
MTPIINIQPLNDELPSHFADRIGQVYANTVTIQHKKENGQFFTPSGIAQFMAGLAKQTKNTLKILDPGCGTAILSSSLIESLAKQNDNLSVVELVVYEIDQDILPYTQATLYYLGEWLKQYNIKFIPRIETKDFVLENKDCFDQNATLFSEPQKATFDIVISNPPYFKIPKDDKRAIVAKSIIWGQPNIYSIFMMVASKLLKQGGELIFITPRSFASGNYFRAFREAFFQEIEIQQIHLFGSRTDTFDRDNVLQETLILKGEKQKLIKHKPSILVTHSNGIKDIEQFTEKLYRTNELIELDSKEKIIHLPTNETDDNVIKLFKSWSGNLQQYDIQISTGPVVSFRAAKYLFEHYQNGTVFLVPLFQLINTSKMGFDWPVSKRNKPQYIQNCEATKSLLLPNKNYVFLRRFSAKDDKSRLVACPYFADISKEEFIGIENHLNYIYRRKGHLEKNEILGLTALLNSNLFDTYFRTFNGNINVSATELREMPLPPINDIKEIGNQIISINDFSQSQVDEIVNRHFDLEYIFAYEQN